MVLLIQILAIDKMENKFTVFSYSKIRIVLAIVIPISILIMVIMPIIISLFNRNGEYIGGGLVIVMGLLNWFITPKYAAKSILEVGVSSNGLSIRTIRPFIGNKTSEVRVIKFDELKSYKFEGSYSMSTFKITLRNGVEYRLTQWYNDDKDQFHKLVAFFEKRVKNYNSRRDSLGQVERERTLYESRKFLISIAILLISVIIATIIMLCTVGVKNSSGAVFLFIFLSPLIWVLIKVVNGLRR